LSLENGAGADIYCRTKFNASVLHLAAEAGKTKTFKWILDNSNLTINDLDCHNWTPLRFAACNNQIVVANYLLEHGANLSIASIPGNHTPLHLAAAYRNDSILQSGDGQDDSTLVECLIQHGADVMVSADSKVLRFPGSVAKASRENMYWTSESNVTQSQSYMVSPLHCAASSGAIQRAKTLLAAGADIHARVAPGGITALHLATSKSLRSMVRFLILRGLDHQLTDAEGHTMVHYLSLGGRYEPVSVKDFLIAEKLYDPSMETELVTYSAPEGWPAPGWLG
jgi:ankyrin repeat protein